MLVIADNGIVTSKSSDMNLMSIGWNQTDDVKHL